MLAKISSKASLKLPELREKKEAQTIFGVKKGSKRKSPRFLVGRPNYIMRRYDLPPLMMHQSPINMQVSPKVRIESRISNDKLLEPLRSPRDQPTPSDSSRSVQAFGFHSPKKGTKSPLKREHSQSLGRGSTRPAEFSDLSKDIMHEESLEKTQISKNKLKLELIASPVAKIRKMDVSFPGEKSTGQVLKGQASVASKVSKASEGTNNQASVPSKRMTDEQRQQQRLKILQKRIKMSRLKSKTNLKEMGADIETRLKLRRYDSTLQ